MWIFFYSKFYRFKGYTLVYSDSKDVNRLPIKFLDTRMLFDWRVATKEELIEYVKMLFD